MFLLTTTAERFFPRSVSSRSRVKKCPHPSRPRSNSVGVSRVRDRDAKAARRVLHTVLFACVHNAGRSQMAAAWFNLLADASKARAISAGTDPASRVHPEVVEAMNEVGVDLAQPAPHD